MSQPSSRYFMTFGRVRESERVPARFAMPAGSRTCQPEANDNVEVSVCTQDWQITNHRIGPAKPRNSFVDPSLEGRHVAALQQ
jgi:hypothetical protein